MELKDKVVVVTGASEGLGREIALKLAKQQTLLALIARSEEKLKEVANDCDQYGSQLTKIYKCDIKNLDEIVNTCNQINNDFARVNVLINNAGVWQKLGFLEDMEDDLVTDVIDINLRGLIFMTKKLIPLLKNQSEAAVINISSKSGVTTQPGQSVYTASKWGVTGFTEVLKEDLKGTSVRVAGLYQGGTNTKLFEKTGEHFNQDKFTNPSDLAEVVVFMLTQPPKIWLHDVRVEY